ncbi:MAG: FIST N-terminal domain-containing protein [Candidatus Sedimenticola sp. (ex Thyasira tokunagai)]
MEMSLHRFNVETGWNRPLDKGMDSAQALLIIFSAARPNEALATELTGLHQTFSSSILIGCSSSGEIYGEDLNDDSIVVAVLRFQDTRLKLAHVPIADAEESASAGRALAEQLATDDLTAVFTLTDGLLVNGSAYVESLGNALPTGVVVTGGLAGDGDRFEKTWVLYDGETLTGQVAAVGLYGDAVRVTHGSRGGWDLLGPEREVTRSEGNVLYSLDAQPALQVYKKYLGERADGLPATGLLFPLAIRNEEDTDGLTVRTILAVDEQKQSITFAGDVPEGCFVKLMRANFDRLIDGAGSAAESIALGDYQNSPALCIAISCVGRRLVLGPRVEEEIEAVSESLPTEVGLIGYYSYGEISPLASGRCDLHNQTMTLTLIWESG